MDSTYAKLLQAKLREVGAEVEVMNAGIAGSDPFFDYNNLQHLLLDYNPDIILQSFFTNDYYQDIYSRGGKERFKEDGTLEYRSRYWWGKIYSFSYLFRLFIYTVGGYDVFMVNRNRSEVVLEDSKIKTVELFKEYQGLSKEKGFELVVFTFPVEKYFEDKEFYNEFYHSFQEQFALFGLDFYNMMPCYQEYIRQHDSKPDHYYWDRDLHHNNRGYEMMAECLVNIVLSRLNKKSGNYIDDSALDS